MRRSLVSLALAGVLAIPSAAAPPVGAAPQPSPSVETTLPLDVFFSLLSEDPAIFRRSLDLIDDGWRDGYAVLLLELAGFLPPPTSRPLLETVRAHAEQPDASPDDLFRWVWRRKPEPHPEYARFKKLLYGQIDPRFAAYFDDHTENAKIRLDEIRWGGVKRDGIPPLDHPAMISATDATYLDDTNVVFGIEIEGDARAYPKRILAWHEMFKDDVGDVAVAGVYCTLCGSMIVYETETDGAGHELGTSGFLYRSNKLMYDHATESLWSTLRGAPVLGPLVGKGIRLDTRPVVTTTWGTWKERHPGTTVLSLETGHVRDYGEGVAYRDYFATDDLMFTVPERDERLANKAEVVALRFGGSDAPPVALSTAYLDAHRVHHGTHGGVDYVILTEDGGANRVYETKGTTFVEYDGLLAEDTEGRRWRVSESALESSEGVALRRLPSHRAFWFGWHAAYPETKLIR